MSQINERRRTTLFLMEQVIIAAIFIVIATVCVQVFVSSSIIADNNNARDRAVTIVSDTAEMYKSCCGETDKMKSCYPDASVRQSEEDFIIYYDEDWVLSSESAAYYEIRITDVSAGIQNADYLMVAYVAAFEKDSGEEIFGVEAASQRM